MPELPEAAAHIWGWFQELSARRTIGMVLNPITWPEIEAWARLNGIKPKKWELDALCSVDDTFRTVTAEDTK